MKKIIVSALSAIFLMAVVSFADDHGHMHEMMMKGGGPKTDDRTELKIPAPMKVMQKGMMRQHLDTISEITAALAANDLNKTSTIAKTKLGWTKEEEKRCSTIGQMAGEADFVPLGKAVHLKADELADTAKAGNRDKAIALLSELITNCNTCHQRFRH